MYFKSQYCKLAAIIWTKIKTKECFVSGLEKVMVFLAGACRLLATKVCKELPGSPDCNTALSYPVALDQNGLVSGPGEKKLLVQSLIRIAILKNGYPILHEWRF